jgi:alpha-beta hydrolase superfamily lysophospholipase
MKPATLKRMTRISAKFAIRVAAGIFLVIATLLLAIAFGDRSKPELHPWHEEFPAGEFRARDLKPGFTLDDYLAIEDQLFAELDTFMLHPDDLRGNSDVGRYVRGGPGDPATFERNWNRTFELVPQEIRGGVLLLHGLSDSPYSMRSFAQAAHDQGYYVLALRLPGHGTVPASLIRTRWSDWAAAIEVGARHVAGKLADGQRFVLGGYSNGGALAVRYTLQSIDNDDLPTPDRVFLLSPAIGVTRFALASNWHKLFSWIPYFEKSRWVSIQPEYDPFKYNSFPKNAAAQSWAVARQVQAELTRAETDGRLASMPPLMTFQSAVDSTIIARDVVDRLYRRLPANGSELVIFDVNSVGVYDQFFRSRVDRGFVGLGGDKTRRFRLTKIANASPESNEVVARTTEPFSDEISIVPLNLAWPRNVYSLAHVSLPFPPDDLLYGAVGTPGRANLGELAPRGEKNVLNIAAADLLRLRYNPFHDYMIRRIIEMVPAAQP